jgi:hypothetical protein
MNIYNDENLFTNNEFKTEYYAIINYALSLNRKKHKRTHSDYVYYEAHHILPKSLFPEYIKEKWNIVLLTPEEHIKCHKLLVDMTTGEYKHKMVHAAWCMVSRKTVDREIYDVSDTEYGELKRAWSETMSKHNTGRICSEETKQKISKANKGRIPAPHTIEAAIKHNTGRKKCPLGVEKSRLAQIGNSHVKGYTWWTNGVEDSLSGECPADGWYLGRTFKFSDKTKRKIGEAGKGRIRSEKSKKLQSEKMKGYIWPEEFGAKISAGKKGKKTNQQEIMGRRYAGLPDLEFNQYISTMKSLLAKNRATNLRNKWKLIISEEIC